MVRAERINRIASIMQAQRYLEIGVAAGTTFFAASPIYKVGVDPQFGFDIGLCKVPEIRLFQATSDAFFRTYDGPAFDLIYLDGLHTFEQTLRDFLSSLNHAHADTVWLIDDTVPTDPYSALPDQRRCRALKRRMNIGDTSWMGDVFKTIYFIHDFFPHLSFATYRGHGQTLVWREPRTQPYSRFDSLDRMARMEFMEFLDTRDAVMNFRTDEQIEQHLKKVANPVKSAGCA